MENLNENRLMTFFPWLTISDNVKIGEIEFVPYKDSAGNIDNRLQDIKDEIPKLFDYFRDIENKPITNCVIMVSNNYQPSWNINDDNAYNKIITSTRLLSLATFAKNFLSDGAYTNSSVFKFQHIKFNGDKLDGHIYFRKRHRLGYTGDFRRLGCNLGTLIGTPLECSICKPEVDGEFAEALSKAYLNNSSIIKRLIPALAFFNAANTDSDNFRVEDEIILMASAYEQLLDIKASSYKLSCEIGELLKSYGTNTVNRAKKRNSQIKLKKGYEAQQGQWYIHRKWAEEFYDLRSKIVHGDDIAKRKWAWDIQEHIVFAVFLFPLSVKLCLERESAYNLSDDDKALCKAIDILLSVNDWFGDNEYHDKTRWERIVYSFIRRFGTNSMRIQNQIYLRLKECGWKD